MAKPPPGPPDVPDPSATLQEMSQAQLAEHLQRIHEAFEEAGGESRIKMDPPRGTWDPVAGVWRYGTDLVIPDPSSVAVDETPMPAPRQDDAVFDFPPLPTEPPSVRTPPPPPPAPAPPPPPAAPSLALPVLFVGWGLVSAILGALVARGCG